MATFSKLSVGDVVELNVGGTPYNFIVVHQGNPDSSMYDSSCDGTWLMMENIYEKREWDNIDNDYANSDIHAYLNGTFLSMFDSDIQSAIKQVKLPYRKGSGSSTTVTSGSSGLAAKVFLLSYTEVGFSRNSDAPVEGAVLSYFNGAADSKRVAKLNGSATPWWLRSPYTGYHDGTWHVYTSGAAADTYVFNSHGVRPVIILPSNFNPDGGAIKGSVNIGGTYKELVGGYVNIGGTWKELCGSYVNIGGTWKQTF